MPTITGAPTIIDHFGGRKNCLGYVFLGCSTFLVNAMLLDRAEPNYLGMASIIGAIAAGIGTIIWGNVKEHQAAAPPKGPADVPKTDPTV